MQEDMPKYLFQHLLEALRRDMRHQEYEAIRTIGNAQVSYYHGVNARFNREILQYLRPKRTSSKDTRSRYSTLCVCSVCSNTDERECLTDSSASLPSKVNKLSLHKSPRLTKYSSLCFGYLIVAAAVFKKMQSVIDHAAWRQGWASQPGAGALSGPAS
jgi:hypothetical protein